MQYLNYYKCSGCGTNWESTSDFNDYSDHCHDCGSLNRSYSAEDITPSKNKPLDQLVRELVEQVKIRTLKLEGDDVHPIIEDIVVGLRESTEGTEGECFLLAETLMRIIGYEI